MADRTKQFEKYADLIVKVGANVQPGQEVFLISSIELAPLVRLVASKAYDAGASNVHVDWPAQTRRGSACRWPR